MKRVVVSGLGLVSPLGSCVSSSWEALRANQSAAVSLPWTHLPSQVAARVDDANMWDSSLSPEERDRAPRCVQMALVAAQEAIQDAGIDVQSISDSVGVAIASGIGSIADTWDTTVKMQSEQGFRRVSPFFVPKILLNSASGFVSIKFKARGPNHSVSTACAAGAHAIGDSFRFIQNGYADVMLAGGTESCIHPLAVAGFSRCRALSSSFNDSPKLASRPFDSRRDGFVIAEGSAVLVLEEYGHAIQRNARIYAEIVGYGLSGDAFHITAPDPEGSGAKKAMRDAIRRAGISPNDIGYINAHATSTPTGDGIECLAIQDVFFGSNNRTRPLYVTSSKGAVGHMLGAAGAAEAVFSILTLSAGVIPANVNLEDPNVPTRHSEMMLPRQNVETDLQFVLSNSFGFGGTNACLVFRRFP